MTEGSPMTDGGRDDRFTQWGLLGVGQGGNNVCADFLRRPTSSGIGNRVLLLNTNEDDIDKAKVRLDGTELVSRFDQYVETLPGRGLGNRWYKVDRYFDDDVSRTFIGSVDNLLPLDAVLYTAGLGGGTGNGYVPRMIELFDHVDELDGVTHQQWMDELNHFALGLWPFDNEEAQKHFNAICGLTRLLTPPQSSAAPVSKTSARREPVGPNADVVLLASNEQLDDNTARGQSDRLARINDRILTALELLTNASGSTVGESPIIDVPDLVAVTSDKGSWHGTFALATDMNPEFHADWRLFEEAANSPFVPLDLTTSHTLFAIVRTPRHHVDSGRITHQRMQNGLQEWKSRADVGSVSGNITIVEKSGDYRTGVDVLLVPFGFDLGPLLASSRAEYQNEKASLSEQAIKPSRISVLEDRLERYRNQ
jgi:hypothetical protein